jgi:hypothetical protein
MLAMELEFHAMAVLEAVNAREHALCCFADSTLLSC